MFSPLRRLFTPVLFAGLLFLVFSASFHATARSAPARASDGGPFATIPVTSTVYLPMVANYLPPRVKFGADFGYMTAYTDVVAFDYAVVSGQLGDGWLRVWLPWAEIEPRPGVYDWSVYDPVFQKIEDLDLNAQGLEIWLRRREAA